MPGQSTGTVSGAILPLYGVFDGATAPVETRLLDPLPRANSPTLYGGGRMPAHLDTPPRLQTCDVTVLFTDISDFTSLAERMSAAETAAFLARHIRLIARCVAEEAGTFDKFVGDAVMAYWGAPQTQPDQAVRALRAARRIASVLRADNLIRRRAGGVPVKLRLGLHTGPVAIGDIGAPGSGAAIFGDTVNTGQRIEQLAKAYFADGDEVVGLASAATLRLASPDAPIAPVRWHRLRGRSGSVAVARIV